MGSYMPDDVDGTLDTSEHEDDGIPAIDILYARSREASWIAIIDRK